MHNSHKSIGMKTVSLLLILWIVATASAVEVSNKTDEDTKKFSEKFSKASCEFTIDLFKQIIKNHNSSNIIFSPTSISILLTVLQQGAKGNTAAQLEKVLRLSAEDSKEGYKNFTQIHNTENVTLEWGNRCYIKPDLTLQNVFQTTIKNSLDVGVEKLDFGSPKHSAKIINKWIKEATHEQITNLVEPESLNPSTVMVLINAIFFKGTWLVPFKRTTLAHKFELSPDYTIYVQAMSQRNKYYSEKDTDLGAKWIQLPFQNRRFAMIFILPIKRHSLNELVEKMTGEDLHGIFSHKGISNVKIRLPKFKLKEKVSLVDTLKKLGLTDIFTEASDLSGISDDSSFKVSDIIHQANSEIDVSGSIASAVTVVQLLRMRTPNLSFIVDQPFLFFIIDLESKIPIFAGKVANPLE